MIDKQLYVKQLLTQDLSRRVVKTKQLLTQRRRRRRIFSFYPVDQRFAKQLLGSRSAELLRVKQLVGSRHLAWFWCEP